MFEVPEYLKPTPSTFSPIQAAENGVDVDDYPYEAIPTQRTSVWLTAGVWKPDGTLRCLLKTKDGTRFSADATHWDNFRLNSLHVPVMFLNPEDHIEFEPRLRFQSATAPQPAF